MTAAASIGTFLVIGATAIAAIVQLRHMRANNQLTGLLNVLSRVEDPSFNTKPHEFGPRTLYTAP